MSKSLKGKFTLIYFCLVFIIALLGTTSVFTLFSLSKSINGLMVDNYKSIDAVNHMQQVLEDEDKDIFKYIYSNDKVSLDVINKDNTVFNEWFKVEANNITEPGEKNSVTKISSYYNNYMKLFSQLQNIKNKSGTSASMAFYNSTMTPQFLQLTGQLKELILINQNAMFNSKDHVTSDSEHSTFIILILSIISVLGGTFFSRFFVNRLLKPIYALTEAVKSIKESDLNKQTPITSQDEIGELTEEFNKMTNRLLQFEQSTMGKLLEEKNKSVTIVKSISDPLIVLDTDYKIILLNDACEKFFGIEEKNVLNKFFLNILKNKELYNHIYNVFTYKDEISNQKIIYFQSNGKDFYFNVVINLIKDINLNVTGLIILFQNVTELKELENIKFDFISTISHEFKTPLTSIMIGTSLIKDESLGELNEKQESIISTIKEDSENLLQLVNNLLELLKIESNNSIFNIQKCSIIGIIDTSIKTFYEQAMDKDITLYYEADERLPKVKADFEKISWVINNLISNALKFTNAGDEIVINAFVKDNKMCISVRDTGVGISEDYQKKIFEKFVQVKGSNSEIRGTGLGLSIAKEIVEAHGGEIWCESKLDLGSTFTFTLPLYNN